MNNNPSGAGSYTVGTISPLYIISDYMTIHPTHPLLSCIDNLCICNTERLNKVSLEDVYLSVHP